MNYARLDKSKRLQRVAGVLMGGGNLSALDIISRARVTAVSSAISELRRNGLVIDCECDRNRIYRYRFAGIMPAKADYINGVMGL